ncbi:hypothetical protein CF15_06900 [Pyrodictium occultum]|uniref:Uncharacterized protein n=1 Tax=Pyrodictium occultum TaxID=2309 RepID=A0A0V8RWK8_PYROC|nr:hypothetical protein [Pyrodictium occultum]KSW12446.1 hypothetical protein CF15_06900 [Pyrodictium occultum]
MAGGDGLQRLIRRLALRLVEHGVAGSREHAERIIAVSGAVHLVDVVRALEESRRLVERYMREGGPPVEPPKPLEAAAERERG